MASLPGFRAPTPKERLFNRVYGFLVGVGIGFSYNYLLQAKGRKTGKIYSTPIDLLEMHGQRFLVAPRGRTQWVRNAEVSGEITLKKGRYQQQFRLRSLSLAEKPPILKTYLERFRAQVQQYFPLEAGAPLEAFAEVADNYPAFELTAP